MKTASHDGSQGALDGGRGEEESLQSSPVRGFRARGTNDHQWAAELRVSDERCTELRKKYDEIVRN